MAKKKTPGPTRAKKKPNPTKSVARGLKSAGKPAKGKQAVKKKPSPAKRQAAPKKKAAVKKAPPVRQKKATKKTTAPAAKRALPPARGKQSVARPSATAEVKTSAPASLKAQSPKPSAKATAPVSQAKQAVAAPEAPKPVARPIERKPLKERVVMEFEVHSNPNVLFELLSTPSGFSEWYCDDVDVRGDVFTFKWGNDEETVTMIGRKAPEVIRFRRSADDDPAAYFEFRIRIDDMTNEVALIVTDHAWPGESGNVRSLWASQIANLTRVLGA